tara:strand:+ start:961 stop:1062 length:102 start_codon:yes stop_codon:yes gene_type:complete
MIGGLTSSIFNSLILLDGAYLGALNPEGSVKKS